MQRVALSFVLFFLASALGAASFVSLASLEGEVRVLRAGETIPSERVTEGFALEPFDVLVTGVTGKADVRIPSAFGVTASLRLDPGTTLGFDFAAVEGSPNFGVDFLAGGVSVQVSGTSGTTLLVRFGPAVFSGAPASFRLVTSPAGDLLVSGIAGKTSCQFEDRTLFAEPGTLVESLVLDGRSRTLAVNGMTRGAFETSWLVSRTRVLREQAAVYFRTLASGYLLQTAHFQRAWERTQRESKDGPRAAVSALTNLRRVSDPLERSLPRLRALRALYDEGLLAPSVELTRGHSARDFFRQAAAEETALARQLGQSRGLFRTSANLVGALAAGARAEVTYDSAFFH